MTTIYIAGPMTGLPEYNYSAFQQAEKELGNVGYTALNPASHDISGTIQGWQYYMREGLRLLLDADAVATLPNWQQSRGASLEVHIAHALEMPVAPLDEWLAK